MNYRKLAFLLPLVLVSAVFAQFESKQQDENIPKTEPIENSVLLDGLATSGIGSFATPQRPVLLNPAAVAAIPQTQLAMDHLRFYWGIGDELYASNLVYAQHFISRGVGVSLGYFGSDKLTTQSVGLYYGQRLTRAMTPEAETRRWGLFGGVTVRLRRLAYIPANMRLEDPNDPLFSNSSSKMAVSAGAGLIYQAYGWRVFLTGDDLNMPNMALGTSEEDRLPLQVQLGVEVVLPWWKLRVSPLLSYRTEYDDFSKDFDPTLGLHKTFLDGLLDASFFAGRWAFGVGGTYYIGRSSGPGFGYELSMPTNGIGIPSHRITAIYRFNPLPPSYPDLAISDVAVGGSPVVGGKVKFNAAIVNHGLRGAGNVPVNFWSAGRSLGVVTVPWVPGKGVARVELEWMPNAPGMHFVHIRADDAGGTYPEYNGRILETNETNNSAVCSTKVHGEPKPDASANPSELKVTQLTMVSEDEPVVPIVFFEPAQNDVPDRFDGLLELIGKRLSENPNATIAIEGYFGEDDGAEDSVAGALLAVERARNIALSLTEDFPELNDRLIISNDHNPARPRAIKENFQGTRQGGILTAQENRRVELRVAPSPPNEWNINTNPLTEDEIEIIRTRLDSNPLFELVAVAPTLDSAFQISRDVKKLLGRKYSNRVYSREDTCRNPQVVITAGGILYEPRAFEVTEEKLTIEPGFGTTKFDVNLSDDAAPIKKTQIRIYDDRGKQIWDVEYQGDLPDTVAWDWTGPDGKIVAPEHLYFAEITVSDIYGQTERSPPETLRVIRTNRRDISERLILVQFTFAEAYGEPDYASVRIEHLAREVVNRVEQDESLEVIIGGHTDIVGVESANYRLSERRAKEQLKNLRRYMMKILSFDNEDQLDEWLKSHHSTMSFEGYGPSRPYTITREDGEQTKQIIIGDNELPSGRITNRRVEIQFIPISNE